MHNIFVVVMSFIWLCLMLINRSANAGITGSRQTDTNNNEIIAFLNPGQGLRGNITTLTTGAQIHTFLGVRYGQPPIGNKRFAEPEAADDWQGIVDAVDDGTICWQTTFDFFGIKTNVSEDCLLLHIYSPSLTGSVPVMVLIHGGGFVSGSGEYFDGSTLAAKGVVVVTINYRLGAFGFMSTEDDALPGNYGMLDQILAFKWVQKNIHAFGGDSKQVTIFGGSAGSASVSLHLVSPLSKGLFRRAIMESGSSLSLWAVERPATEVTLKDYTRLVGSGAGCPLVNSTSFLECMRDVDAESLFNSHSNVTNTLGIGILTTPRIENTFGFLPNYPQYLLDNGLFNNVDTLRGFNSGEWSFVINDTDDDGLTRDEFALTIDELSSTYSLKDQAKRELKDLALRYYVRNESNPFAIRSSLVTALTDLMFASPEILELRKYLANGGNSSRNFVYELDYMPHPALSYRPWEGVTHGQDGDLVFAKDPTPFVKEVYTAADLEVADKVQTLWTNFAKSGNPVSTVVAENGTHVQWEEYSLDDPYVLKLNITSSLIKFPRPRAVAVYGYLLDLFSGINSTINIDQVIDPDISDTKTIIG